MKTYRVMKSSGVMRSTYRKKLSLARQGVHHVYNKVEYWSVTQVGEESSLLNC